MALLIEAKTWSGIRINFSQIDTTIFAFFHWFQKKKWYKNKQYQFLVPGNYSFGPAYQTKYWNKKLEITYFIPFFSFDQGRNGENRGIKTDK